LGPILSVLHIPTRPSLHKCFCNPTG